MGNKNRKSGAFVHIGSLLPETLDRCRPPGAAGMVEIWNLWADVVGDAVARQTKPAAFKGKLLLVHVSSSVWLHHLRFLEKELVGKLNVAFGKDLLEKIRFQVGPV